jgi:hypothetical protein
MQELDVLQSIFDTELSSPTSTVEMKRTKEKKGKKHQTR